MVPLLSAVFAGTLYAVPIRTWAACAIAFVGVVVMGADGDGSLGGAAEKIIGRGDGGDTTQPLFSSLFAYLLLGETLGPYGYVGATLIGISLLLVSK